MATPKRPPLVGGGNPKQPLAVEGTLSPQERLTDPQAWARIMNAAPKPGEVYAQYKGAVGEKVVSLGDAYIVLGKDRPSTAPKDKNDPSPPSGHFAGTNCSTIDTVVGRWGKLGQEYSADNPSWQADPNFKLDAARIYISQQTDIDDNIGLTHWLESDYHNQGVADAPARNKSAIALKADGIRIVARESIKLVTMTDHYNSTNNAIEGKYGIDLIAGVISSDQANSDLQPLVKGYNMVQAMLEMAQSVALMDTQIAMLNKMMSQVCTSLTTHIHLAPGFGAPSTPDVNPVSITANCLTLVDNVMQIVETNLRQFNHASYQTNYLTPGSATYILSPLNKTT